MHVLRAIALVRKNDRPLVQNQLQRISVAKTVETQCEMPSVVQQHDLVVWSIVARHPVNLVEWKVLLVVGDTRAWRHVSEREMKSKRKNGRMECCTSRYLHASQNLL